MVSARSTQPRRPPPRAPPRASADKPKPITGGAATAITPGMSMRFSAAEVAMSTHFAVSGVPVPSRRPGISRNWRRISGIISMAASPTAVMVMDAMRKGIRPPMNRPISTWGSPMCRVKLPAPALVRGVLYRLHERRDDGEGSEGRSANGEAFTNRRGGVAELVEGVGDLPRTLLRGRSSPRCLRRYRLRDRRRRWPW